MKKQKFINCKSGGDAVGSTLYYQMNRPFEVTNDVWFQEGVDFQTDSWEEVLDISTEDGNKVNKRLGQDLESIQYTLEATLKLDINSTLQREVFDIKLEGDTYFNDFIDHGVNVKVITNFGDGSFTEQVWRCGTVEDINGVYNQKFGSDAEVPFNVVLNKEPEVKKIGFFGAEPEQLSDFLSADIDVDYNATTTEINVNVSNVVDVLALVLNNEWQAVVYDENGEVVDSVTLTDNAGVFTGTIDASTYIAGDYQVSIQYAFFQDPETTIKYYKNYEVKQITV